MDDELYMREALEEARKALDEDEVPVGAVVVCEERVIGRAHNQRETLQDPTAHAEMIAITQAAAALGSWRMEGATVYATLEPCAMCTGAMILARVDRLVYGASDPKAGACGSVFDLAQTDKLNHKLQLSRGVLEPECSRILSRFFRGKRAEGKK